MHTLMDANQAGKWALVTGASSGIGAEIAAHLATLKWNVVLVGRDQTALDAQAQRLTALGVQAHALSVDLSGKAGIERVLSFISEKNLTIEALVNNAGFGIHANFLESDAAEEARMLDLQLAATLALTKDCLKGMLAKRAGYILNVASVYAFSPVPNQAVYAACKAFMLSFSRTLALELHGTGVGVSVLCPGITLTKFRSRAGMKDKQSAFALTPETVAEIGVRGMLRGKFIIVPGWGNKLYTTLARCLPAGILGRFTRWFNRRRGIAGAKGTQ